MNVGRGLGFLTRLVTALVGLGLVAAGAYGIAIWADLGFPDNWPLYADRQWYFTAPDQQWWPWALIGLTVVAIVLGIVILAQHLRPRRAHQVSAGANDLGSLSVEPSALGDAVEAQIADLPGVERADSHARVVRGHGTITVKVRAVPDADVDELHARMSEFAGQVADSLGENAPHMRFLLGFSAPGTSTSRVE